MSYRYKLFTLSKFSDFDKVIPPLLYDLYKKCNQEVTEDKPVPKGIYKENANTKENCNISFTSYKGRH